MKPFPEDKAKQIYTCLTAHRDEVEDEEYTKAANHVHALEEELKVKMKEVEEAKNDLKKTNDKINASSQVSIYPFMILTKWLVKLVTNNSYIVYI